MNRIAPVLAPDCPLTVLHVITKGEVGGAQTHVRTLCKALQTTGRVRPLVAIGDQGTSSPLARALHQEGIPVLEIPSLGNRLSPSALRRCVHGLRHYLHSHRIDLLHAHSAAAGVVTRIAGLLTQVPVVYTVHGFAFKPGAPWSRRAPAWAVECALAPLTRHLVCVSTYEARLARWLPIARNRVSVVRNGLEDCPDRAQPGEPPLRVAMVARLAPPKRPDLLLNALAQVREVLGHEIPVSFIGDGPQKAALQSQAHRLGLAQATFTGDVDDVPARLAAHAIGVLVSDHEGLPLAVIEAMRAGLAVVATDLPGTRELLPGDLYGVRVANDAGALAAALLALLADPNRRIRMGAAARERYVQMHSPTAMAQGVLGAYERALA